MLATAILCTVLIGQKSGPLSIKSLPHLQKLDSQKLKTFTGSIYVRDLKRGGKRGYVKRHYRKGMAVIAQDTFAPFKGEKLQLTEFLKTLPKGTDVRFIVEKGFGSTNKQ